jgi:aldehyde:ferredoxin oxidoreductase
MASGITGQILRVDLRNGKIETEFPGEDFYRIYFGGTGIIMNYLLKEVPKGIDPLGKENKLIFAAGPLTGSGIPGTGRNSVGAKSPLTGGIGFSEAGGFWGSELKKSGFDAVIIEGCSKSPVYLVIDEGQVELRDATHLWGKLTDEVETRIKEDLKNDRFKVCQVGIAGEHLRRYSNIANDLIHFYGRTGMGAVMGSKKLKAIAVRGTHQLHLADRSKVLHLIRWMNQEGKNKAISRSKLGTAGMLLSLNELGGLPTRNFREGQFEGAEKISGETIRDTVLLKRETCHGCPVRCKCVVSLNEPYVVNPVYGGPEYETLAALGSLCGIDNLAAICKANEICNAYGIDTISVGVCIAFAMECYERGILTEKDTGGLRLNFGNAEGMLTLVKDIVSGEGIGALLARGVKYAAEKLKNCAEFAMHIKGQEIPLHEPRLKKGLGLGYIVSPTGADHCHNVHDTAFTANIEDVRDFGIHQPLAAHDLGAEKVTLYKQFSNWRHFENCALLCMFVPWTHGHIVDLVSGTTGWPLTLSDLLEVGERAMTLARMFNLREGFGAFDDTLPRRFHTQFEAGPLAHIQLTQEELMRAKQTFYSMVNWDGQGKPTPSKLRQLKIEWVADCM